MVRQRLAGAPTLVNPMREGSYRRLRTHLRSLALVGLAVLAARRLGFEPPALPTDRCTGKPLVLRDEDAGFVVSSTGLDGSDDGGDPLKDIVFRVGQ